MRWGTTDRTTRLKRIFRIVTGATPATAEPDYWDGDIVWVTPEDLAKRDGRCIARSERMITDAGFSRCGTTMIPPGSVIISTRAPIGYVALSNVSLCFNQGCKVLVPRQEEQSRYWLYVMRSRREELRSWGRGATYDELGTQQLKDFSVPWPKLEHQRLASDHLDVETGRIDALIDRKERFVELLLEKRTALITHAVTKGLDPNVQMKDSGIEWVGDVPAHWDVRAVWMLFRLGRGRVISEADISDNPGQYPVYSSQTQSEGILGQINTYDFEGDHLTWTTDGANAGTVFKRGGRFSCTNVCGTLRASCDLDYSFLAHALGLATRYFVRSDINPKLMNNVMATIRVHVPPLQEQCAISAHLVREAAKIDALVDKTRRSIELLKEYRTALISAAVTGQIDVTAKQPEVVV